MRKPRAAIQLILLLISLSPPAHALEEEMKMFTGIRGKGMGGLITTTGNYSEALFGNPARHSEVDTWKYSILDLSLEINSNLPTDYSAAQGIRGSAGASTISAASKLIGKNEHALMQLMMAYYNPHLIGDFGFAVAMLARVHTNLAVNYTTDLDTQTLVDVGPHLGLSHTFLDNNLSLGLNLHLVYRVAADGQFSSLSFLTGSKLTLQQFGRQGIGADGDLGAYYHVPWEIPFMRIALGLSINNLMKSHFDEVPAKLLTGVGTRPTNNDRLYSYGFRFNFPDLGWFMAPLLAVEFQDNGDAQKLVSFAKKTHVGGEAKLSRVLSLRAGLNQGYLAGGFGIDLPFVKLDVATYGEELSGSAGEQEDRRYMFRLALEL